MPFPLGGEMRTASLLLLALVLGLFAFFQNRYVPPTKTAEFVQGPSPQQTLTVEEASELTCQCQETVVIVAYIPAYRPTPPVEFSYGEELREQRRIEHNRRMRDLEVLSQRMRENTLRIQRLLDYQAQNRIAH